MRTHRARMTRPGYLHLRDLSALVVAAENCDSVLEANLEGDQQSDCLHRVVAYHDENEQSSRVPAARLTQENVNTKRPRRTQACPRSVQHTSPTLWAAVLTSVDIVTHEQVVCVRRLATDTKQFHQVMKLSVDITADSDRTAHWLHILLLHQDILGLHHIATGLSAPSIIHLQKTQAYHVAELLHISLGQMLAFHQLLHPFVQLFDTHCGNLGSALQPGQRSNEGGCGQGFPVPCEIARTMRTATGQVGRVREDPDRFRVYSEVLIPQDYGRNHGDLSCVLLHTQHHRCKQFMASDRFTGSCLSCHRILPGHLCVPRGCIRIQKPAADVVSVLLRTRARCSRRRCCAQVQPKYTCCVRTV